MTEHTADSDAPAYCQSAFPQRSHACAGHDRDAALLTEVRSLLDDPNTPDAAIGRALRSILTRPIPPAVSGVSR